MRLAVNQEELGSIPSVPAKLEKNMSNRLDWMVDDGSYSSERERFPAAIQKRIEDSCRKQGWLLPGEEWHEDDRRPYGPGNGIGKGWLPVVVKLDEKLAEIDPDYQIHQIKEKFGGLRYYVQFSFGSGRRWDDEKKEHIIIDPEAYAKFKECSDLINQAEYKCSVICDVCGASGKTIHGGGWSRTRCEEHA